MLRQFLCAFTIAIFLSPVLFAADWVAFRGPDGNGKSPDTGLLKQWSPEGPKLLWQIDFIGYGYSSVAIYGDRIYISGNVERDGQELTMIFCLDKDGNKIWENDNGPAHSNPRQYPGTRGTPTIAGGFVYDKSAFGYITCFNAATGEIIWRRNPLREYEAPRPFWFIGNSVLIEGELIIYPLGGPDHIAVALNKRTGETVWRAAPTAEPPGVTVGYTTPYAFDFEGTRVVTVMSMVTVEGLDAQTGRTLFSIPWRNRLTTNCTMPIYHDGRLFLSTGYNFGAKMFQLAKNADGTITPTEIWYEQRFDNQHGGLILVGDYVYGSTHESGRASWGAINFMTGEIGYLVRVPGMGAGSITYADGLLYFLSEDTQTVVLVKPDPTEFVELSRFELPNEVEGRSWAHPVVFGGKLYVRHGQFLYCYDVRAE